jgi:hypothetical protein
LRVVVVGFSSSFLTSTFDAMIIMMKFKEIRVVVVVVVAVLVGGYVGKMREPQFVMHNQEYFEDYSNNLIVFGFVLKIVEFVIFSSKKRKT